MYRYKRLLVAVDLSDQDPSIVRYAGMISRMAQSERVYFVHVSRTLDIPAAVREEYPELSETPTDIAEQRIGELISDHFTSHGDVTTRVEVTEGSPITELLRFVRKHDVDLVLVGKPREDAAGSLGEKLARKAPCSVLIVPTDATPQIRRIVVATDFSEHAADAMDAALAFARAAGQVPVTCVHAYDVPIGYHKLGKSYDEFAEVMKHNAERDYARFAAGFDLQQVVMDTEFVLAPEPADAVAHTAESSAADLVVIGARGRSDAAAVLLGSITEQVIQATRLPLLAVKKKGTGLGLLDALLSL